MTSYQNPNFQNLNWDRYIERAMPSTPTPVNMEHAEAIVVDMPSAEVSDDESEDEGSEEDVMDARSGELGDDEEIAESESSVNSKDGKPTAAPVNNDRKRPHDEMDLEPQVADNLSASNERRALPPPHGTRASLDIRVRKRPRGGQEHLSLGEEQERGQGQLQDGDLGEPGPAVRSASVTSSFRTSRLYKHWPKLRDADTFENSTVSEQRAELSEYMQDLMGYADMIQAGAIPIGFVNKFFTRLDAHLLKMDQKLDQVEVLHRREAKRKAKMSKLLAEAKTDHEDLQSVLNDFELPSCR